MQDSDAKLPIEVNGASLVSPEVAAGKLVNAAEEVTNTPELPFPVRLAVGPVEFVKGNGAVVSVAVPPCPP